jgi:SAM-dependent methyltransferase
MRAQRPAHLAPAIDATAEHLPFADDSFDAAMASFTIHQWTDLEAGLREVRRVTRGPVVILTCDPTEVEAFWLSDYAPKVLSTEARRYPSFDRVADGLGTPVERIAVPIPFDCRDGFNEAYYGRPERLLEPAARLSCSAWSFITADEAEAAVAHLAADLKSGTWDQKYGALRHEPTYRGSLYLLVSSGKAGLNALGQDCETVPHTL